MPVPPPEPLDLNIYIHEAVMSLQSSEAFDRESEVHSASVELSVCNSKLGFGCIAGLQR